MTDDVDRLISLEGPNKSIVAPRKDPLTDKEKSERFQVLSRLLQSGMSDEAIMVAMQSEVLRDGSKGFSMTMPELKALTMEVFKSWENADKERTPHLRSMARRRMYEHLDGASRDGSWTAVASLEKVLSTIEGTMAPVEIQTTGNQVLMDALQAVLGEITSEELTEIIRNEISVSNSEREKPLKIEGKSEIKETKRAEKKSSIDDDFPSI